MNMDYSKFAMSRDDILSEIILKCKRELYERAQPSANYDELLENWRKSENRDKEKYFDKYYLSQSEFKYVVEKYAENYGIKSKFKDHLELLIANMKDGTIKDKWIPERTDEHGTHPGYRGYEDVAPIKKMIGEENAQYVINYINDRIKFYSRDRDYNSFTFSIYLSDTPTSNLETVKEYWKSQGVDLDIDKRAHDSDYFWCEEHGYLEDEEEYSSEYNIQEESDKDLSDEVK